MTATTETATSQAPDTETTDTETAGTETAGTVVLIDLAAGPDRQRRLHAALRPVFASAWTAATAAGTTWTTQRPATGQCAVTALIVQQLLGGDLVRVLNPDRTGQPISHYFNVLPDGTELDLTRDQFDIWNPTDRQVRSRRSVLDHPETLQRYARLTGRLRAAGNPV